MKKIIDLALFVLAAVPMSAINEMSKPTVGSPEDGIDKENVSFTVKGVTFTMVFVKAGKFMMGATKEQGKDAKKDERPAHNVTLSDYYIGETEVTQALYEAVMVLLVAATRARATNMPARTTFRRWHGSTTRTTSRTR